MEPWQLCISCKVCRVEGKDLNYIGSIEYRFSRNSVDQASQFGVDELERLVVLVCSVYHAPSTLGVHQTSVTHLPGARCKYACMLE